MIIYRPHKGSLSDSMSEVKEFESEYEMKKYIVEDFHAKLGLKEEWFSIQDIVISNEAFKEERCRWEDTRLVCLRRFGYDNYIKKYGSAQCIGMCATRYITNEEFLGIARHK